MYSHNYSERQIWLLSIHYLETALASLFRCKTNDIGNMHALFMLKNKTMGQNLERKARNPQ